MLRTAVKPRWLGLFACVLAVMVTFGMLGLWQLNVARDNGRAEEMSAVPTLPVADVADVLIPHGSFPSNGNGRRITATGRYDGSAQVLVTPRLLRGEPGYWVVTPLVVRSTGARIAVVRGFVTDPAQALVPELATEVTVSGTLAPGESPAVDNAPSDPALPDGQMAALDLSLLVNRWPGDLYNAIVFATAEKPDLTSVASPAVERVPPPALVSGSLSWRNAAYALQWWVFALFAGYMWWRMVRDDYETGRRVTGKATNV
ncbi:MAG: SURF1 family protein [Dermatophilaceae bacterium]